MLAAMELPAVEDVMVEVAQSDQVVGSTEGGPTACAGGLDMRTLRPGISAAGDNALGALPAEDLLSQLDLVHARTNVSA